MHQVVLTNGYKLYLEHYEMIQGRNENISLLLKVMFEQLIEFTCYTKSMLFKFIPKEYYTTCLLGENIFLLLSHIHMTYS